MAEDVEDGGPVWDLLAPHASATFGEVYPLRLLGAVHRLVLAGDAPELLHHYPTTEGDGDVAAMWAPFRSLLAERGEQLRPAFARPPQTNEVGRSVPLLAGLLVLSQATALPVWLLEIGASAGLNLLLDRYYYAQDGFAWGDETSTVRFDDLWHDGHPPLAHRPVVVERRGCDRDPIDVTNATARLELMSYVWPGQARRFELLRDALELAAQSPPPLDCADITDWLPGQLKERHPGSVTVVFHSIVWQYLSDEERDRIEHVIHVAGERATSDAPVAWLRLEPPPEMFPAELRLQIWPGGQDRLLAHGDFQLGPLRWLAEQ